VISRANKLAGGAIETSPKFLKYTGWHWDSFMKHIRSRVKDRGFDFKNHGKGAEQWNIEHRIPRAAYDFTDPSEIKRCWTPENVDVKTTNENEEKGNKLLPEEIMLVPPVLWPKAWGGVVPNEPTLLKVWELKLEREKEIKGANVDQRDGSDDDSDEDSDDSY